MKLGRFALLLGGAILLFCVGLAAFNFLVMPRLIHRNTIVSVPDLRGKTVEIARGEAGRDGLQVIEERQASSPTVPAGRIIEQSPRANAAIRRGRRILVVTSAGPAAGLVPELTGLARRQAEMTLARESFRTGRLLRVQRDDVAVPTVAFQYPPAGTSLRKDSAVDLVIAEPGMPPVYRMPDLRGLPLYQARAAIEAAGCVTASVNYQRQRGTPQNTVLAQTPEPGGPITRGANVELVASGR